ncbi:hypothetical protein C8Q79DRAFT_734203 [Trametes meyenii]|nr:hypothetical protein C8Q79DRAFT_734203 [Trametes meyenii]
MISFKCALLQHEAYRNVGRDGGWIPRVQCHRTHGQRRIYTRTIWTVRRTRVARARRNWRILRSACAKKGEIRVCIETERGVLGFATFIRWRDASHVRTDEVARLPRRTSCAMFEISGMPVEGGGFQAHVPVGEDGRCAGGAGEMVRRAHHACPFAPRSPSSKWYAVWPRVVLVLPDGGRVVQAVVAASMEEKSQDVRVSGDVEDASGCFGRQSSHKRKMGRAVIGGAAPQVIAPAPSPEILSRPRMGYTSLIIPSSGLSVLCHPFVKETTRVWSRLEFIGVVLRWG